MRPCTIALFQTFLLVFLYFIYPLNGGPHQILLDLDIDMNDFFAILYLLKQNRSEFNLKAITINANIWTDSGHSVNQVYDILYVMGGGVRSKNPTGCCPKDVNSSCTPGQCGNHGNLFTGYHSNPFVEFNIFGDSFAVYQVIHYGLPITLVPPDATNTILINEEFFTTFEQNKHTYEAQYCFESLKPRTMNLLSWNIQKLLLLLQTSHMEFKMAPIPSSRIRLCPNFILTKEYTVGMFKQVSLIHFVLFQMERENAR